MLRPPCSYTISLQYLCSLSLGIAGLSVSLSLFFTCLCLLSLCLFLWLFNDLVIHSVIVLSVLLSSSVVFVLQRRVPCLCVNRTRGVNDAPKFRFSSSSYVFLLSLPLSPRCRFVPHCASYERACRVVSTTPLPRVSSPPRFPHRNLILCTGEGVVMIFPLSGACVSSGVHTSLLCLCVFEPKLSQLPSLCSPPASDQSQSRRDVLRLCPPHFSARAPCNEQSRNNAQTPHNLRMTSSLVQNQGGADSKIQLSTACAKDLILRPQQPLNLRQAKCFFLYCATEIIVLTPHRKGLDRPLPGPCIRSKCACPMQVPHVSATQHHPASVNSNSADSAAQTFFREKHFSLQNS